MTESDGRAPDWVGLALLWLAGFCLRVTLLAIPPVMPLIHEDLHLSEKAVGALNGLPPLLLGFAAIFGSLLLARLGALRALHVGLALTALGGALRGTGSDASMLFSMTFVMGLGVAIMQPVMPTLVGRWFPARVGLATAIYVNGLLIGEIASAALTIPLVLPMVGGRWEWSLALWSLPVVATSLIFVFARRAGLIDGGLPQAGAPPLRWWPDWRDRDMWCVGLILGFASAFYFGCNAFIPDYFHAAAGRGDLVGPALTALNAGQLPASLLLLAMAHRFVGRRGPFAVAGAAAGTSVIAMALLPPGYGAVVLAGLVGFTAAFQLVLTMSTPPLFAPRHDVHRFAAGMLAIGYITTFLVSVAAGAVWDASHSPLLAFGLIGSGGLAVVGLAASLRLPRAA